MNQLNVTIGKIIREAREAQDLTQLELSQYLGYQSTQFISLFERGLSKCPPKVLGKLAKKLDLNRLALSELIVSDFRDRVRKDMGLR